MASDLTVPGEPQDVSAPPDPQPAPEPQPAPVPAPAPAIEPGPSAVRQDPVDAIVERQIGQRRAALQTSMLAASTKSPDQHAEAIALARPVGLPPQTVADNLDLAKQGAKLAGVDYDGLLQRHPELSDWLSNHDHAAVAQDDIPALQGVDHAVSALTQPEPGIRLPDGFVYGKNGQILEPGRYGYATVVGGVEDLRALLNQRQEAAGVAEIDRQVSAERLRAAVGGSDTLAMFTAGAAQSLAGKQRLLGTADPSAATDVAEAAQTINPNLSGRLISGLGSLAADAPLMLAGGPLAEGASALVKLKQVEALVGAGRLATGIVGAAGAAPIAVAAGAQTGQEHGAVAGVVDGLINLLVPGTFAAAFGVHGVTKALLPADASAAAATGADGWTGAAQRLLAESGFQASQQATVTLAQALHERASGIDPDALDPAKLASRLFESGLIGGLTGALFAAPREVAGKFYRDAQAADSAMSYAQRLAMAVDALHASKLTERAPDLMQELTAKLIGDGERSVYFTASEFDAAAKAAGQVPAEVVSRLGAQASYQEARATGAEMRVPVPAFLLEAARADKPEAYLQAARQAPGARSASDVGRFINATQQHIESIAQETKAAAERGADALSAGAKAIHEDVVKQRLATGADQATADREATIVAAAFDTLAKRWNAGHSDRGAPAIDPLALYQSYGLRVQRELPASLKGGVSFDALDAALNRVRSGDIPTEAEVKGKSLREFLRQTGVQDQGTELSTMEADVGRKPFQKALIRPDGLPLDQARERAVEAGYLSKDGGINDLLDALNAEAHGKPTFAENNLNPTLGAVRDHLTELDTYLRAIGADLSTQDNAAIKALLAGQGVHEPGAPVAEAAQTELAQAHSVLNAPGESLAFRDLLEQWRTAHGDQEPERGSDAWQRLVREARKIDAANGRTFNQSDDVTKIGSFNPSTKLIKLFDGANLSTFLHESGHFYLEVLGDVAQKEGAPEALTKDYQRLLDWFGVKSRDEITTKQHEQFARAFEAYLLEGRAPSAALRSTFARVKAWLVSVYRTMAGLEKQAGQPLNLTDEVRGVFDRLLATDDAISAAKAEVGGEPALKRADFPDDASYAAYAKIAARAQQEAFDRLQQQLMDEYRREHGARYAIERGKVSEGVAADVNQRPVYVAISTLMDGELPDGTRLPDDMQGLKLDKRELVEVYGADALQKLPGPGEGKANRGRSIYTPDGGISLQVAADLFGFRSGDDLWHALVGAPDRLARIEDETTAEMAKRHPDPLQDGSLPDRALDALHNEQRGKLLAAEVAALGRRTGQHGSPHEAIRAAAQAIVGGTKVRDLRADLYRHAEARAARTAFDALAKGDHATAFAEKQRELFNSELYRAAVDAQDRAAVDRTYLSKIDTVVARERIGKAGGWQWTVRYPDGQTVTVDSEGSARDLAAQRPGSAWERSSSYLQQIDALLERYDLKQVSLRQLAKRQALLSWVAEQEANNAPVIVPLWVQDEAQRTNWRELTPDQFADVADSVRNIEALARLKNKLLMDAQKRALDAAVTDGIAGIEKFSKGKRTEPIHPTALDRIGDGIGGFFAAQTKMAELLRKMDGYQDGGALWELLMRPLNAAADHEALLQERSSIALHELFGEWGKSLKFDAFTKTTVKGIDEPLSRFDRIMVALNWGNAANRQRLMDGFGWDTPTVQRIVDTLDGTDLKLVQGILDHINSYWPEIKAKQERVTGVAPDKVEALPIVAKGGTIDGGYFPIKYDSRTSAKAGTFDATEQAKLALQGATARASTRRGHTKEREAAVTGMRLRLDPGVIFQHLTQVVHDLSHHETLLDLSRLLNDKRLAGSIQSHYGETAMRQLRSTLTDVAAGHVGAQDTIERFLNHVRTGVPIASLAFNLSSAITNMTGITQSVQRVGAKYMAIGMARVFRDAASFTNTNAWVNAKSGMMRLRSKNYQREVAELNRQFKVTGGVTDISTRLGYGFMGMTQKAVDLPTWIAGYEKAKAEGNDEERAVALANQVVIDSQGSGAIKDLSSIQRGNVWKKLLTTLYGYSNTTLNRTLEAFGRTRFAGSKPAAALGLMRDLTLLYVMPVTVGLAIRDFLTGGHKDETGSDYMIRLAKEHAAYLAGTVVLGREVAGGISGRDYQGPAGTRGFEVFNSLLKGAGAIIDRKLHGREISDSQEKALAEAAVDTAGILFHLPSVQAHRLIEGILYDQEHQSANPAPLIFGPPPKPR